MVKLAAFVQTYSKIFTIFALILALFGTLLLSYDYLQWSNIKRTKSDSEYGVMLYMEEKIGKQKMGSILVGASIIALLIVELCKR